jgi:uncharacterized delta-60 repeat protein
MKTPALTMTLGLGAILVFTILPGLKAGPGDIDPSFAPVIEIAEHFPPLAISKSFVSVAAVQPDDSILLAGLGQGGNSIAFTKGLLERYSADGSVDPVFFALIEGPSFGMEWREPSVVSVVVKDDSRILIGGAFDDVGGVHHPYIAQMDGDGGVDAAFNPDGEGSPNINSSVLCLLPDQDGEIWAGGGFGLRRLDSLGNSLLTDNLPLGNISSLAPIGTRQFYYGGLFQAPVAIGNMEVTPRNLFVYPITAASKWNDFEGPDERVFTVVRQADGKLLVGGQFLNVRGIARPGLARLNADGTLDSRFNPKMTLTGGNPAEVRSIALQTDGKIIVGGFFNRVQPPGAPAAINRGNLVRLNSDGSLDTTFNCSADNIVNGVTLQKDGRVLVTGFFRSLTAAGGGGPVARSHAARLFNGNATQTLGAVSDRKIRWLRGGTSPEVYRVTFERSTDNGLTWSALGNGTRISGGWELSLSSPLPATCLLRGRARYTCGYYNGSSSLIETVAAYPSTPEIAIAIDSGNELQSGDDTLAFGQVGIDNSEAITLRVSNTGNAPLTGFNFSIDGDDASEFTADATALGSSLAAGSSALVHVKFKPMQVGTRTALLRIISNDGDSPFEIALTGEGVRSVQFDAQAFFVLEEAGPTAVQLRRKGGTAGSETVHVTSTPGTALQSDFIPVDQIVTFADGEATATLDVAAVADVMKEANETFILTLIDPSTGLVIGPQAQATVYIVDPNDSIKPTVAIKTPASKANIPEGDAPVVTGSAADNQGVRQVLISLNGDSFSEATLSLAANGKTATFSAPLPGLVAGPNEIIVKAVDTRGNESTPAKRVIHSIVLRPLTVLVSDPLRGKLPRPFPGTDPARRVGFPITLTATATRGHVFDGWTANDPTGTGISPASPELPKLTFIHQEGLVLTANFIPNPFLTPLIGSFAGLIQANPMLPDRDPAGAGMEDGTAANHETVGHFQGKVTSSGAFSGTLRIGGQSLAVRCQFDNDGQARFGSTRAPTLTINRRGKAPVELQLNLDLTGATDRIVGTVSQMDPLLGPQHSLITAFRAHYTKAQPVPTSLNLVGLNSQPYTFAFQHRPLAPMEVPDPSYPLGDGSATGTLTSTGAVRLAVRLSDRTAFTASAALSKNQQWPLFASLYRAKGSVTALMQAENQTDHDMQGTLHWIRPPAPGTEWYPAGWPDGIPITVIGARYLKPASQELILTGLDPVDESQGHAELVFTKGLLANPVSKAFNFLPNFKIAKAPLTDASFSLSLVGSTGAFNGSFLHDDGTRAAFQGVVFQKGAVIGGYGAFQSTAPRPITGQGEIGQVLMLRKQ